MDVLVYVIRVLLSKYLHWGGKWINILIIYGTATDVLADTLTPCLGQWPTRCGGRWRIFARCLSSLGPRSGLTTWASRAPTRGTTSAVEAGRTGSLGRSEGAWLKVVVYGLVMVG